jgi:WD40 repeat protein
MKPSVCLFTSLLVLTFTATTAQDLLRLSLRAKGVTAITTSHDNKYLALAQGKDLVIYSAGTDTKIKEFSGTYSGQNQKFNYGHSKPILDLKFNNKTDLLATASADKTIKLWKMPSGELLTTLEGHTDAVVALRFAEDDKVLVSASEDMTIRKWDLATLKEVFSKKEHTKPLRGLDVSADGKWIASGGGDQQVVIYNTQDGAVVKKIPAHKDWVRTLAFSPDSKMLASGGDDRAIRLWSTESWAKEREFQQRGWIYDLQFSGDGKYIAVGLEKNAIEFYDVKTGLISLKLSTPTPVLKINVAPDGKSVTTVEEFSTDVHTWDIANLNISPVFNYKDSKDKAPPQIFVSNPPNLQNNRVTVYKDILDLRGSVVDESGVRQLKVNGVQTPIKENGNFLINLPLAMGDNSVSIEVTDINDNIALKKFVIARKNLTGEEYNPANAKNYLMVIGINNYQYWPKLNNAVRDASDVASTLLSKYNFEFDNIVMLKEEQATRSNIYNSMRGLIEKIGPQDNLLIYYSGHGYFDQLLNEGYWVPVEAHTNSNGDYISNTEILKIINNINSQHTFLVADACFSGSLFAETTRGYSDNVEKFKSRWGLVSGRLEVVSDGALGDNSPFAKNFISYLKENQKSKFAVSELIQHVKIKVAEASTQTPLGNPLKNAGDEGGEFIFYKKN